MATENSTLSAKPKGKPRGRPFKPGTSGNPGGRPKGFAERIRELTNNGEEMIQLALDVMRGKLSVTRLDANGQQFEVGPSIKERLDAMTFLTDRGLGKAPQAVEVSTPVSPSRINLDALTDEQFDALGAVILGAVKAPAPDSGGVQGEAGAA